MPLSRYGRIVFEAGKQSSLPFLSSNLLVWNCVLTSTCGRDSTWVKKHKSIFDYLMHKLESADERDMEMFKLWTTNRMLDHFIIE